MNAGEVESKDKVAASGTSERPSYVAPCRAGGIVGHDSAARYEEKSSISEESVSSVTDWTSIRRAMQSLNKKN